MTNAEKYRTMEERTKAFDKYCEEKASVALLGGGGYLCEDSCSECQFKWLEQENYDD